MIRETMMRIFGMREYVKTLQELNEHLAAENIKKTGEANELRSQLFQIKDNDKKLYEYNHQLEQEKSAIARKCQEFEKEVKHLNQMCTDYNTMLANVTFAKKEAERHLIEFEKDRNEALDKVAKLEKRIEENVSSMCSLKGTISSLKRKLAKYEKA